MSRAELLKFQEKANKALAKRQEEAKRDPDFFNKPLSRHFNEVSMTSL